MKPIHKLTQYFFDQAAKDSENTNSLAIQEFQSSLLDVQKCPICLNKYLLSQLSRLPRILIHCGHTFCGECLQQFHIKNRVRCPMCLKLIKSLSNIYQLPINHTIYQKIARQLGQPQDPSKFLCTAFTISTGDRLRKQNPPETDQQTGLKHCAFHRQRVQHFFCIYHETPGCRQCMQVRHKRTQCKILDLYQLQKQTKNKNK